MFIRTLRYIKYKDGLLYENTARQTKQIIDSATMFNKDLLCSVSEDVEVYLQDGLQKGLEQAEIEDTSDSNPDSMKSVFFLN